MTEITLTHGDARATIALARRRGANLADRRARPALAGRSGDLERHQSDPLSGRRLDARRRAGRGHAVRARPARLRQVRDLRRRSRGAGLCAADAAATTSARARSILSRSRSSSNTGSSDDDARGRDRSRQSGRAAGALRLRPASRLSLAARRAGARGRARALREGGAARGSAHRAGRAGRQDHASDSASRPRPAALATRSSPTTRSVSSTARADRSLSSTPRARRSRWSFPAFRTPRCGRGPARRSSALRPGPATAIRTASRRPLREARHARARARARARATRRASSSGRSKVSPQMPSKDEPMTEAAAFVLDGAAIAEGVLAKVAEEARALVVARRDAGPGGRSGRRQSGEPSLCRRQGQGGQGLRLSFDPAHAAGRDERSRSCWRSSRRSTPIRPCTASSCSCRCPRRINSSRVLEAIAPHKDVDGFHPINVGLLSIGDTAARSFPARRPAR